MGNRREFDDSADALALLPGRDGVVDNHDARHFAGSFGKDDKDLVVVSANLGHCPHLGSTAPRPGEIAVVEY
jgi:hypothetical protein